MRAARAQISAAEQPILHQIQAERQANLAKAQQQMGFAKAAAALLQGVAPRVQDTYSNAANADAGYAGGLSSNVQTDINQRAADSNAFLSKMGTPNAGLEHPADVGGTAYGLEGYIPATTLQREGAAFGSAAQMLPGQALRQGQQQASATLANDPNLSSLQSDLAKLQATQPAVYQQVLSSLQEQAYKKAELGLSAGRLDLARQSLASENAYRQAELGQSQQRINISAQSAAQSAFNANRNYKLAAARLGISQKSLQLRALQSEAKTHGASGGFTPNELMGIKQKSYADAQQDFSGIDSKGNKLSGGKLTFKQAFKRQILNGIPPSIALKELAGAGYNVPKQATNFQKVIANMVFGGGVHNSAQEQRIVQLAHQYMGTPYVWGGASPKGFDCSGFAQYLYGKVGVSIPRTTYTQWTARNGRAVPKSQLQPGDLVFFRGSDSKGGLPGHVGIYIGGGKMIDAPHTGADVRVDNVFSFGGYMGARRFH